MDFTQGLNDNQKEAVLHTEGPLLILAGAGSGKTRVITHRIAHLIKDHGIAPWKIFAVTFTNKAAAEMKERLVKLIGSEGNSVFVKTFHSASVFLLRKYGNFIDLGNSFSIYDGGDQQIVVKQILAEMKIDPKRWKPNMFVSKISEIKNSNAFLSGGNIDLLFPDNYPFDFSEVYKLYEKKLKENNALDFNDLILHTVKLLRSNDEVLAELHRRWQYFMVDEYQDTNYAQYIITKMLASYTKNLCVVGDDDQSIYSWRGADITNILNFEKDYDSARTITLDQNYRSTQPILSAATGVISNNSQRKGKSLHAYKGDGEPVVWCQANNEYGEAEYVVNTLTTLKYQENYRNSDFAVFYRTNAQSRVFEDRLRRENIPYKVVGGLKFYDRKEIKDIIGYLKFVANPADSISLFRVINTPARGIGKASMEKIQNTANEHELSDWEIIEKNLFPGKPPKGLENFRELMSKAIDMVNDIPQTKKLSDLVTYLTEESGYTKVLKTENSIDSKSRLENISEFINGVYDYENERPETDLSEFLQDISLLTSEETAEMDIPEEDRNNIVTLMTIHNAKGLEFPVVFLTGMEEKTFPHSFSLDDPNGLEEERRLCYVGITRAMDRIYLTNAELRRSFNNVEYKQRSRFISEIPNRLLEATSFSNEDRNRGSVKKSFPTAATQRRNAQKRASTGGLSKIRKETAASVSNIATEQTDRKFPVKSRVAHRKFGFGIVKKVIGKGDNTKLVIKFNSGEKTVVEKYTPLSKVD